MVKHQATKKVLIMQLVGLNVVYLWHKLVICPNIAHLQLMMRCVTVKDTIISAKLLVRVVMMSFA